LVGLKKIKRRVSAITQKSIEEVPDLIGGSNHAGNKSGSSVVEATSGGTREDNRAVELGGEAGEGRARGSKVVD